MIVCVAEKPSVGREIARVLGANATHEGYMEGNGYQVTWTFGHLCGLKDPAEYSDLWKAWSLSSLPMIPERFGIKLANDTGIQKQFRIIQSLISQADTVVNCGDAGQEGELIQRWVYQLAGCRCPVKRLWINSMTEEAIREGFQNLKDQDEYQHLYEAGLMRTIGDWLLGMNATRAYTLRYAQKGGRRTEQVLSIGRVQTPTLALIVNRQHEIEHFVPKTYWELKTLYRETTFSVLVKKDDEEQSIGIEPIKSKETGEDLVKVLEQQPFVITKVEKKKGTELAPRLFDLTSLQVECNKKYGLSAEDTLKLIQSLYEKKVTTYPRVDTTYLPEDVFPKCGPILRNLEPFYPTLIGALHGAPLRKSKKVFDNSKVTDHHAIIPTGEKPTHLTAEEKRVYDLVALRFIAAFYPDCEVAQTTVWGEVNSQTEQYGVVPFKATGRQILKQGWRVVFAKATDNADDCKNSEESKSATLPAFVKGEHGQHAPQLVEKQTTPPKPYTEATLLRAMETAGKMVDDEELRDAMKENGIGRPSTRAAIIEKLFDRHYIVREKKALKATSTGVELIHTLHTPLLMSASLTGQWEKKLRQIERGEYTPQQFLEELKVLTGDVVKDVKLSKIGMLCPVCRKGIIIRGRTAYGCSRWREGCTYREPLV